MPNFRGSGCRLLSGSSRLPTGSALSLMQCCCWKKRAIHRNMFWVNNTKRATSFLPLITIKAPVLVIQSWHKENNLPHLNANLSSAEDSVQWQQVAKYGNVLCESSRFRHKGRFPIPTVPEKSLLMLSCISCGDEHTGLGGPHCCHD